MTNENEMARVVRRAIEGYFRDLDGNKLDVFCMG